MKQTFVFAVMVVVDNETDAATVADEIRSNLESVEYVDRATLEHLTLERFCRNLNELAAEWGIGPETGGDQ